MTNVGVTCTTNPTNTYTVGGAISGLGSGLSVTLRNNGGDALTRNANGAFTFATPLASGAAYAVTVGTQPTGQTCVVGNGSGTIGSANVTNVDVVCASPLGWVWQGGSKLVAPAGVYGTKGVPSTTNAPGGRNWNGSWVDPTAQVLDLRRPGVRLVRFCERVERPVALRRGDPRMDLDEWHEHHQWDRLLWHEGRACRFQRTGRARVHGHVERR